MLRRESETREDLALEEAAGELLSRRERLRWATPAATVIIGGVALGWVVALLTVLL